MEILLLVLLFFQLLGTSIFGKFEVETPAIQKIAKWLVFDGISIGLYFWIGNWALAFPVAIFFIGGAFHFYICKKHGFDPFKATPRKKYYAFRHWEWVE